MGLFDFLVVKENKETGEEEVILDVKKEDIKAAHQNDAEKHTALVITAASRERLKGSTVEVTSGTSVEGDFIVNGEHHECKARGERHINKSIKASESKYPKDKYHITPSLSEDRKEYLEEKYDTEIEDGYEDSEDYGYARALINFLFGK